MNNDKLIYKNVWISSWVLSVSLLGDALLYVILPVNAEKFGVSMVAVGFLLAINRIIRTFTYNLIVAFGQFVGIKKLATIEHLSRHSLVWHTGFLTVFICSPLVGLLGVYPMPHYL